MKASKIVLARTLANPSGGQMGGKWVSNVKIPEHDLIYGISLYETQGWKLLRFIPLPNPENKQGSNQHVTPALKSRVLFSEDGKQLLGAAFERPYGKDGDKFVSNHIVRWDIESGTVIEEKDVPKLGSYYSGVWWLSLSGGQEVWWPTYSETHSHQTQDEARECKLASSVPAISSEAAENCAYNWAIGMLDIESGKIKYLASFKKNPPQGVQMERELRLFSASISPDGAYLVQLSSTSKSNTVPPTDEVSIIDVINRKTQRLEGRYSSSSGIYNTVFSGDSKYFAVKASKRSWLGGLDYSAMIFELPGTKINVSK